MLRQVKSLDKCLKVSKVNIIMFICKHECTACQYSTSPTHFKIFPSVLLILVSRRSRSTTGHLYYFVSKAVLKLLLDRETPCKSLDG